MIPLFLGHTPNFEEIVSRCNGEIIVIDTGAHCSFRVERSW